MHSELLLITQKSMNVNVEWTPKVNYIEKPYNRITTQKKRKRVKIPVELLVNKASHSDVIVKKITTTAKYWQVDKKKQLSWTVCRGGAEKLTS